MGEKFAGATTKCLAYFSLLVGMPGSAQTYRVGLRETTIASGVFTGGYQSAIVATSGGGDTSGGGATGSGATNTGGTTGGDGSTGGGKYSRRSRW